MCIVIILQTIDVVVNGDSEMKKFLLIEVFSLIGVLVGYYWGSSKDSEK